MRSLTQQKIEPARRVPRWLLLIAWLIAIAGLLLLTPAGFVILRLVLALSRMVLFYAFGSLNNALVFEFVAVVVLLLVAFNMPVSILPSAQKAFHRLGRIKPGWSIFAAGALASGSAAAVAFLIHWPEPMMSDEFGYLLMADTFQLGRPTNPTHPMWVHFEAQHVIHQPTYIAKFPPAQGLLLAFGQMLGGHPIVGVWLSVGLAAAAICWMLHGWLPPRWATLGGLLAAVRLTFWGWPFPQPGFASLTSGYWAQSYWGGAIAAAGGALVFGAARRIVKRRRIRDSVLLGVGLAVLATSRPFEGLLVSLPAAVVLACWILGRNAPPLGTSLRIVVAPILAVLIPTAVTLGWYNHRVSGDPLRLPYQVHQATYEMVPHFLWQPLRPAPTYNHQILQENHTGWKVQAYTMQRSPAGFLKGAVEKIQTLWRFFIGPVFTIPLLVSLCFCRNRWTLFTVITCTLVLLGLISETHYFPHYAAPITGLVFVLLIQGIRRLNLWRRAPAAQYLAIGIPIICLLSVLPVLVTKAGDASSFESLWGYQRVRLIGQLSTDRYQHLVLVRYGPKHSPFEDWVHNDADLENANVIWARDMGPERNRALLQYYRHRKIWLLEPDRIPLRLRRLEQSTAP